MKPNILLASAMIVLLSWYTGACKSTSPQIQKEQFSSSNQESSDQDADEFDDSDDEDNEVTTALTASTVTHPKEPTAWSTRRLIMTTRQPSPREIENCLDAVESVAKNATNLEALNDAAFDLQTMVTQQKITYHWCFYQLMASLDEKLDQPLSLMEEKADIFLDKMARLWILAGALDGGGRPQVYMNYLKSRYTSISLQTFGRQLEPSESYDSPAVRTVRSKSAGAFSEE